MIKLKPISLVSKAFLMLALCVSYPSAYAETKASYPLLQKHIKAKNYAQAYLQASKLRADNEGDPKFDFLYGISALESGHNSEAVYVLERVVNTEPRVIRPRIELSRAYLKQKNDSAAIRELEYILTLKPSPVASQQVNTFISQIKNRAKASRKALINSLLSFSLGYGDNINFGYDNNEIQLPIFGLTLLDANSIEQKSGFAETRLRVGFDKPVSSNLKRYSSATLHHREYFKTDTFNISDLDLRTGVSYNKNKIQYRLGLRYRPVLLKGSRFADSLGVDAALSKNIAPNTLLNITATFENFDDKRNNLRDRGLGLLSGSISKKTNQSLHQVNAFIGIENPKNEGAVADSSSRDFMGLGYQLSRPWNATHKSYLKLDYKDIKHQGPYPLYPQARKDDRYSVLIGHTVKVSKKLNITLTAKHTDNNSNLELFDIKQNEVKIGVQYAWK